jgi:hypothetical protein
MARCGGRASIDAALAMGAEHPASSDDHCHCPPLLRDRQSHHAERPVAVTFLVGLRPANDDLDSVFSFLKSATSSAARIGALRRLSDAGCGVRHWSLRNIAVGNAQMALQDRHPQLYLGASRALQIVE